MAMTITPPASQETSIKIDSSRISCNCDFESFDASDISIDFNIADIVTARSCIETYGFEGIEISASLHWNHNADDAPSGKYREECLYVTAHYVGLRFTNEWSGTNFSRTSLTI